MMMNQKVQSKSGSLMTLPMFANVYKMETVLEQNKKNDWWGWKITLNKSINDLKNPSFIVGEAQNFHELVSSGSIDPAPEAMADAEEIVEVKPQSAYSEVLG